MCIRDRVKSFHDTIDANLAKITFFNTLFAIVIAFGVVYNSCLLYTSDAADDLPCVDLGGRRIIKKQKPHPQPSSSQHPSHPPHPYP